MSKDSRHFATTAAVVVLAFSLLSAWTTPLHGQGVWGAGQAGSCQPGQPCYQGGSPAAFTPRPEWLPVAKIEVLESQRGGSVFYNMGTGTTFHKFDDGTGLVVTNWHVTKDRRDEDSVVVNFVQAKWACRAKVLEEDEAWDVAVLHCVLPPGLAGGVEMRDTMVQPGEQVMIAGYAHASDNIVVRSGPLRMYMTRPEAPEPYTLEVTTTSEQGMSGGPMLDSSGRLVGVLWGSDHAVTEGTACVRIASLLERWRKRRGGSDGDRRSVAPTRPGYVPPNPANGAKPPVVTLPPREADPVASDVDRFGPIESRLKHLDDSLKEWFNKKQQPVHDPALAKTLERLAGSVENQSGILQKLHDRMDNIAGDVAAALPVAEPIIKTIAPAFGPWGVAAAGFISGISGMAGAWQLIKRRIDKRYDFKPGPIVDVNQIVDAAVGKIQPPTIDLSNLGPFIESAVKQAVAKAMPRRPDPLPTLPQSVSSSPVSLTARADEQVAAKSPPPAPDPTFVPVQVNDPELAALKDGLDAFASLHPQNAAAVNSILQFKRQFLARAKP